MPKPVSAASLAPPAAPRLTAGLVWLMAGSCGLVVANIYYNQPLLVAIEATFRVTDDQASFITTVTQVGYALGMLLLVPLGDKLERKRLITWLLLAATACLAAAALASGFYWLVAASGLLGLCSAVPQLLLPLAAHLAPEADRGRVVGRVMSGLLLGILLSRTASGYVGAHLGWRAVFGGAAGFMLVLAALLAWLLPCQQPSYRGTYGALMQSVLALVRELPPLRQAALVGGSVFGAFSVFWTALTFYLAGAPYHYGSDKIGFFGLIGAAGALAAPLAGRVADRRGPRFAIVGGVALALAAYVVLGLGGGCLAGLVLGVLLLDAGVQTAHIGNQTLVFSLRPEARSRLNTVYMTTYFTGGALGSVLGGWAWAHYQWPGVCMAGAAFALLALVLARRH